MQFVVGIMTVVKARVGDIAQDLKLRPLLVAKAATLVDLNLSMVGHPNFRKDRTKWTKLREQLAFFVYDLMQPGCLGIEPRL